MKLKQSQKKRIASLLFALFIGVMSILLGFDPSTTSPISEPLQPGSFRVLAVADGDTIVIDMNGTEERVRLIGIDTPEKNHPQKPVQCFAQAATDYASSLLEGRGVRLESDPLSDNRDIYNRLLRYVYVDDIFVNYEIVAQGYGFAYTVFPFSKSDQFEAAELAARSSNLGLWGGCELQETNGRFETNPT